MSRFRRLIPYLIAAITLIVFASLFRAEFTSWDDIYNISHNPRLNPPTLQKIAWYWAHEANGLYIPITYTVWGALAKLAWLQQADELGIRLNPYVFHIANVLVHVASALVVYAIMRMLVKHDWAACVGALVFALHPVQVEAVGWVSGLKDVLCGSLSFVAIWAYLRAILVWIERPRDRARQASLYALAILALVLAMLSKPTAMVVPAIAFVLHVWGLHRPMREAVVPLLPWFVLAIACAVVAKLAQPGTGVPAAPLWARPLIALDSLAFYLYKLVFPARLGIDYGWRPTVIVREWWFYVIWIAPLVLLIALLLNRKRNPVLLAAGAVFVIGVAPVLGFATFLFQYFSTVADHYLYISMLGVALAAAWVVARFFNRNVIVVSVLVIAALGARSIAQTFVWRDDFALFGNAIRVNPDSFVAWHNLGYAQKVSGQRRDAELSFRRAIRIKPDYWEAHQNLADVLLATGRSDEAIAHLRKMIEIKSSLPPELRITPVEDHVKLGDTLAALGRYEAAADHYRAALALNPDHSTARQKLDDAITRSGKQ